MFTIYIVGAPKTKKKPKVWKYLKKSNPNFRRDRKSLPTGIGSEYLNPHVYDKMF